MVLVGRLISLFNDRSLPFSPSNILVMFLSSIFK